MKLPEDKREEFKEPKGKLFRNSDLAFDYVNSIDYEEIITVGDMVSATFIEAGFEPDVAIVDFNVERKLVSDDLAKTIKGYSVPEVKVENPAGVLTEDLWRTIKEAETPVKIIVSGEEDLATLPATLFAPLGSVVIYGQPGEGLVVIEVTESKKDEFRKYREYLQRWL